MMRNEAQAVVSGTAQDQTRPGFEPKIPLHLGAVHPGPVGASHIAHYVPAPVGLDARMNGGDEGFRNDDVAIVRPAQRDGLVGEGNALLPSRGDDLQGGSAGMGHLAPPGVSRLQYSSRIVDRPGEAFYTRAMPDWESPGKLLVVAGAVLLLVGGLSSRRREIRRDRPPSGRFPHPAGWLFLLLPSRDLAPAQHPAHRSPEPLLSPRLSKGTAVKPPGPSCLVPPVCAPCAGRREDRECPPR